MPKTRTHNAQPLSAMLPGSYSTALENRFAELHNLIALQGVTTADPMAVALRGVKTAARDLGVTFERVIPGSVAASAKAPAKAAPAKAAKAPKEATETTATKVKTRVIKPEQIEALQVAGTISESAPYGCDAEGRALAPYGRKNDGTPMKRRGRVAAPKEETPAPAKAAPAKAAKVEAAPVTEEASEETPAAPAPVLSESELDALLDGL